MSPTRILAFTILALVVAGFAIYTSPGSYAYLLLTGRCRNDPVPAACHVARPYGFLTVTRRH